MTKPNQPSLELRGGTLLRGLNVLASRLEFQLGLGQSLAIMGPSGVGKTSLLRALAGFVDQGLRLNGDWSWHDSGQVRFAPPRPFGLLLQPAPLPGWMNVQAFFRAHMIASSSSRINESTNSEYVSACELVGLDYDAIRHKFGRELSHGMRTRVGIASLLLLRSSVNLIDEPFAGVDEPQRQSLLAVLKDQFTGPGKLLLAVTHSPFEAAYLAQEVLVLPAQPLDSFILSIPSDGIRESRASCLDERTERLILNAVAYGQNSIAADDQAFNSTVTSTAAK